MLTIMRFCTYDIFSKQRELLNGDLDLETSGSEAATAGSSAGVDDKIADVNSIVGLRSWLAVLDPAVSLSRLRGPDRLAPGPAHGAE